MYIYIYMYVYTYINQLTVATKPLNVVKPLCNIRKKFRGFKALLNTAPQKGAMNVLQSAYDDDDVYLKKITTRGCHKI
jgi:hypothetical protein